VNAYYKHIIFKSLALLIAITTDIIVLVGSVMLTCQAKGDFWWTIPLSFGWITASTYAGYCLIWQFGKWRIM
jgi:hypothetical protein